MPALDLRSDFNACPLGPFTKASKLLAWPDKPGLNDLDPEGVFFSIVEGGKNPADKCCRMHYRAGAYGTGHQYYRFGIGAPNDVVNLEFYFLFEDLFDFPAGGPNADGGKVAPRIVWGSITGGTNIRIEWWHSEPPAANKPFIAYLSNLATGAPYGKTTYSAAPIETGRWYCFLLRFKGGPDGLAEFYLDKVLFRSDGPIAASAITDSVTIDFSSFFGGGGSPSAPTVDCYARMDRVHIWTGTPLDYG